jgi:hypothetical protein
MTFYSYLWLRATEDTPWYVGKGSGNRAYQRCKGHWAPKDRSRIFIFPQDSEADAFESERSLIWLFGRKDLGSGCLHNTSDGGEGGSNPTASTRAKQSQAKLGNKINLGMKRSLAARARMAEAHKGKCASFETRAKQSAAAKNKPKSSEHAVNIGLAVKQWRATKKYSAWNKGIKMPSVSTKMMGNQNGKKKTEQVNEHTYNRAS